MKQTLDEAVRSLTESAAEAVGKLKMHGEHAAASDLMEAVVGVIVNTVGTRALFAKGLSPDPGEKEPREGNSGFDRHQDEK